MSLEKISCELCKLPSLLNAVSIGNYWTLNIAENASNRPWLVLQSSRHTDSIADLTELESEELGVISANLVKHLESLPGVHRAHIHYLNETQPSHTHIHFTVSSLSDFNKKGEILLGESWPKPNPEIPQNIWLPPQFKVTALKKEPSFFVRSLVKIANGVQKLNFIYPMISKLLNSSGRKRGLAAEIYVGALLLFFSFGLLISSKNQLAALVFSLFGLFRIIDLWSTHIAILIDRRAKKLKGFERTLVLAILNCAELALISGIWAIYFYDLDILNAFNFGFHVATNRAETIGSTSIISTFIDILGTATSLLLLVAVVAMALGRLTSDRFEETKD